MSEIAESRVSLLRALPMRERIECLRADGELTERCLRARVVDDQQETMWRARRHLAIGAIWEARLGAWSADRERFIAALALPDVASGGIAVDANRFLATVEQHASDGSPPTISAGSGKAVTSLLVAPLLRIAAERLRTAASARNIRTSVDSATLVELVEQNIAKDLVPTVLSELQTELAASSSRAPHSGRWIAGYFRRYPALLTYLDRKIARWAEATADMLARYESDAAAIRSTFGIAAGDELAGITGPLGDPHCGGHAVHLFRFASGTQIVFKPRPVACLAQFQNLLAWLERHGFPCSLPQLGILDRGTHGWSAYVPFMECASSEEAAVFHKRQGAYLAILYFLGGRDLIRDNVIARGSVPCLVDLECLISPPLPPAQDDPASASAAGRWFGESVVQTGLLPTYSIGDIDAPGPNLGGLSRARGADEHPIPSEHHLPHVDGVPHPVSLHAADFVVAFIAAYRFIVAQRDALLARDGPLTAFAAVETRVLLRHTQVYARIDAEARHPDYAVDAACRDYLLDHYWNAYDPDAFPGAAIQSEIEQSWDGDIPYFYARSGQRHLFDQHGVVAQNFFPASGFEAMRQRIRDASETDLRRQLNVIHRAFAIFEDLEDEPPRLQPFTRSSGPSAAPGRPALVAAALRIGDEILRSAFASDDELNWVDVSVGRRGEWDQTVKPAGLYDGTDGIAVFFGELWRVTGEARFRDAARHLVQQSARAVLRLVEPAHPLLSGRVSAFLFPGSVVYAAEHLAAIGIAVDEQRALRRAYVRWVERELPNDATHDVLAGACGAIPLLLDLIALDPDGAARDVAVQCGEHLCRTATRTEHGVAWSSPRFALLGGFAHGTAACAWALFRLAAESGEHRFRETAFEALRHDQSLYIPGLGAWRDARHAQPKAAAAWCHGSAGIALGRLLCQRYEPSADVGNDLAVAAAHIEAAGFNLSHCLCHGQLGNLDILLSIAEALGDHDLACSVFTHLSRLLGDDGVRWRCGMSQRSIDFYGLFMGLSGIGYALLRFADRSGVPNILALELPRT